jgi:hypothetical protein
MEMSRNIDPALNILREAAFAGNAAQSALRKRGLPNLPQHRFKRSPPKESSCAIISTLGWL